MNDFFKTVYDVIFQPNKAFQELKYAQDVRRAIGLIAIIALFLNAFTFDFRFSFFGVLGFLGTYIAKFFLSLLFLMFVAFFFNIFSYVFNQTCKLKNLFFLLAFAQLPYIFYAPIKLIKFSLPGSYFFSGVLEFLLYLWITFLTAKAIETSLDITLPRAFLLILTPFLGAIFIIFWGIDFFTKIFYMFKI